MNFSALFSSFLQFFLNNYTERIFCCDCTGNIERLEHEDREGLDVPAMEICLDKEGFLEFF